MYNCFVSFHPVSHCNTWCLKSCVIMLNICISLLQAYHSNVLSLIAVNLELIHPAPNFLHQFYPIWYKSLWYQKTTITNSLVVLAYLWDKIQCLRSGLSEIECPNNASHLWNQSTARFGQLVIRENTLLWQQIRIVIVGSLTLRKTTTSILVRTYRVFSYDGQEREWIL